MSLKKENESINLFCLFNIYRAIGIMSLGDQGSISGRVIPKTQKMVFDAALFITQYYKVSIKDKVEQSREWSSDLPYTLELWLLKREPLGHLLTKVANFTFILFN